MTFGLQIILCVPRSMATNASISQMEFLRDLGMFSLFVLHVLTSYLRICTCCKVHSRVPYMYINPVYGL